MTIEPFLIANTRVGLERDLEPFLLPNDAYPELEDCYLWRGRIKKKQGYILLGRLQRKIGTTDIAGDFTITLPNIPLIDGISSFIIGTDTFQDPTPTGGGLITLLTNGAATVKTLNRTTGVLTINGSIPNTDVFYYPGLPVMGLRDVELTTLNQTNLIGFDTRFSYIFSTSTFKFVDTSNYKGTATIFVWTGSNSNFFWTTNYAGAMWTTNNIPGFQPTSTTTTANQGDGIKWFDQDLTGWVNFLPPITGAKTTGGGTTFLMGALMMLPYKGRLLAFNTWEGTAFGTQKQFAQRVRWCQIGTPYNKFTAADTSTLATLPTNWQGGFDSNNQAWSSDVVGKGGFIDAPTLEQIVSVEFVKDTLIVFFERSTWQLRYTGNELLPFVWEKINTELGATSTFSEVPFDKVVLGVGDVGIHACDAVNVERIDQKIPDEVFGIQNTNNGRQRVYGIRDYFNQLVYWTFPFVGTDYNFGIDDENANLPPPGVSLTFPNRILSYNYIDQSYSFFNDSFTCFGYYQRANDLTWGSVATEWQNTEIRWVDPVTVTQFPLIVAGNQLGFVETFIPKTVFNDNSLFISNVTIGTPLTTIIIPNHNLTVGTFVRITSAPGTTNLDSNTYKVNSVVDENTFTINTTSEAPTGTYIGGGTISLPSNINIVTKTFNPFMGEDNQVRLHRIDFYFDRTTNGQLTVNLYINGDSTTPVNTTYNTINTSPETTYSASPDTNMAPFQLWKRINFHDISQLFQVQITMNDTQMMTDNIVESDVVLHGMILYFSRAGRLLDV